MDETISAEEIFEIGLRERNESKKRDEARRSGTSEFNIKFTALELGQYKQVRILGYPAEARMGNPHSAKTVNISLIEGDDGKKTRIIWPDKSQKDWILWQIYRKVMAYKWNSEEKSREYYHKKEHKTVWNMVANNSNPDNPYDRGWEPTSVTLLNVIDRSMMDIHRENKNSLVLSKKASKMSNGEYWYEPGIPTIVYEDIYDKIAAPYGPWMYYDIVIVKNNKQPFYNVYHAEDSARQLSGLGFEVDKNLASRPLTDEELSWGMYDFDRYYSVTSYTKILNRLGNSIQKVDKSFGTKYHELLSDLASQEIKERGDKEPFVEKEEKKQEETPSDKTESTSSNTEAPRRREKVSLNTDEKDAPEKDNGVSAHIKEAVQRYGLEGFEKLTEDEISFIDSFDEETQTFVYVDPKNQEESIAVYSCVTDGCPMVTPSNFKHCPKCGSSLSAPE